MEQKKPTSIDEYISAFPTEIQARLEQVRQTISKSAPKAVEGISYSIPAFKLHGNLVFFAAFKSHIGFYATPTGSREFKDELSKYKTGSGSVQFPHNMPLPLALISRIVKFRVKENTEKMELKKMPVKKQ